MIIIYSGKWGLVDPRVYPFKKFGQTSLLTNFGRGLDHDLEARSSRLDVGLAFERRRHDQVISNLELRLRRRRNERRVVHVDHSSRRLIFVEVDDISGRFGRRNDLRLRLVRRRELLAKLAEAIRLIATTALVAVVVAEALSIVVLVPAVETGQTVIALAGTNRKILHRKDAVAILVQLLDEKLIDQRLDLLRFGRRRIDHGRFQRLELGALALDHRHPADVVTVGVVLPHQEESDQQRSTTEKDTETPVSAHVEGSFREGFVLET